MERAKSMLELVFELPPGLNKIINNNRASSYAGAGMKKTWTNKSIKSCKEQARQCPIVPVYLAAHYRLSTKANDVDNIQSTKKFILDGIVKAGVIKDDNFTHVHPICFETFEFLGRQYTKDQIKKGKKKKEYTVTIRLFTDYNEYKQYILENL